MGASADLSYGVMLVDSKGEEDMNPYAHLDAELEALGAHQCLEEIHYYMAFKLGGIVPPKDNGKSPAEQDDDDAEWMAYYDKAGAYEGAKAFQEVKVGWDYDAQATIIYMDGHRFESDYFHPERITAADLEIDPEWDRQLKELCEAMELTATEPGWFLTAFGG